MDKLSIFSLSENEVSLKSNENNSLDTLAEKLDGIETELRLTRKGNEIYVYGEEVLENEDIEEEEF